MKHEVELNFMCTALHRMRLQVRILHPGDKLNGLDFGLRTMLGIEEDYAAAYSTISRWSYERTVYKLLDPFLCNYIYFRLPDHQDPTAVVIGPYLTLDPSRTQLLEIAEFLGVPMHLIPQMEEFYASLPIFSDPSTIMALVSTFGETLWGSENAFEISDVNYDLLPSLRTAAPESFAVEQKNILQQMKLMEERYANERELMEIVSKGLTHRAEIALSNMSHLNFQPRTADPLRNMKNYCVICNTILRKAAEQGGVHPLHLDRMSSKYARTIESTSALDAGYTLLSDMIRSYTRLVRTHAIRQYSAIVQKTITYIEANLSGELSLQTIADMHQITPGYLSSIFHKETGRTLTEYVTAQRMKLALYLLKSTRLQVQSIAQLCGFADPNYFTKLFRRYYSVTPTHYRKGQPFHTAPGDV